MSIPAAAAIAISISNSPRNVPQHRSRKSVSAIKAPSRTKRSALLRGLRRNRRTERRSNVLDELVFVPAAAGPTAQGGL